MVRIRTLLILLLFATAVRAQEVLLPLHSAPRGGTHPSKSGSQAVTLPFFDDFSSSSMVLNPRLWQDHGASKDLGSRLFPPTVGVVTLDALDAEGNLYADATTSPFPADTLSSQRIRLDGMQSADSIVMSFYFLPGGGSGHLWERTGETPDKEDSLYLDFYNPVSQSWTTVWSIGGISVDSLVAQTGSDWQYVAIAIIDDAYFDSLFSFRFRNRCSLEPATKAGMIGNCDMWHIDYIVLDQGRSVAAVPEFRDVAFVSPAPSMLASYRAMPARQYRPSEMATQLQMTITNLYGSQLASHYGFAVVSDAGHELYRYDGGYENAPPFMPAASYQTAAAHASPTVQYQFPEARQHYAYTIVHTVREGSAADQHPQNDTVTYRQVFADYYAYDDGTAENGYGLTSTSSRVYLAYRFDLNEEDTLTAVDLYFNRTFNAENANVPFRLTVWEADDGKPGQLLYRDGEARYPEFEGMNTFVRYKLDEPLLVDGSVFVGFEQENNTFINLGFDRSFNTSERIYYLTGTEWQQSILSGSLMMRPCFGLSATLVLDGPEAPRLKIYPNPASHRLHIDGLSAGDRVEIYDIQGHCVASMKGCAELNVSHLQPGIYLLRTLGNDHSHLNVYKIIVTR